MKNNMPILIGAVVLFVLIAGAGIFVYNKKNEVVPITYPSSATSSPAALKYFGVQKPNFVIRGENLGRVEIWATVAGKDTMIGTATLQTGVNRLEGGDTWSMPIPPRIGATAVYARGYDKTGTPIARIDLAPADLKNL